MSEWDRRIREHAVWGEMRALGPSIDKVLGSWRGDPDALPGLERMRAILTFCGKRLAAADPLIANVSAFDEVSVGFSAAHSELELFDVDGDLTHVQTANIGADRALLGANRVAVAYSPEELGALASTATEYRAMAEESLRSLRTAALSIRTEADSLRLRLDEVSTDLQSEQQKVAQLILECRSQFSENQEKQNAQFTESLRQFQAGFLDDTASLGAKLSELSASLQTEQQRLALITADYQRQFSEAQEKRSTEFSEAVRLSQQDLAKVVSDYQGQFSTAQDTRGREFSEAQGDRQGTFNNLVNDYSKNLTAQHADFVRQADVHLGEFKLEFAGKASAIMTAIEEDKARIEKLVGVIGNLGVTSGYLKVANYARKSMWLWQGVTVTAMIVLSILAATTLDRLEDKQGHFLWGAFAARAFLLGSLGVIAAYAGSQADKLFDVEKRNRKLALELEAIGPYLSPLPEDEQHKFRIQVGDRSFGRDDVREGENHRKSPVSLLHLLDSKEVQQFVDLLVERIKKAAGG
jgi:hypothetical protein